jgi:hypothetical protein
MSFSRLPDYHGEIQVPKIGLAIGATVGMVVLSWYALAPTSPRESSPARNRVSASLTRP